MPRSQPSLAPPRRPDAAVSLDGRPDAACSLASHQKSVGLARHVCCRRSRLRAGPERNRVMYLHHDKRDVPAPRHAQCTCIRTRTMYLHHDTHNVPASRLASISAARSAVVTLFGKTINANLSCFYITEKLNLSHSKVQK